MLYERIFSLERYFNENCIYIYFINDRTFESKNIRACFVFKIYTICTWKQCIYYNFYFRHTFFFSLTSTFRDAITRLPVFPSRSEIDRIFCEIGILGITIGWNPGNNTRRQETQRKHVLPRVDDVV